MIQESARVLRHEAFQGEYRLLAFSAPRIAAAAAPGQFVHVRIPSLEEAALRRPFSIYRAEQGEIHVLFKAVGRGTNAMLRVVAGESYDLIGPLGHGFPALAGDAFPIHVAGGYGVAPLSYLARSQKRRGLVFIGGRARRDILCERDFSELGWGVETTTQDGSSGLKGLVTEALDAWLAAHADPTDPGRVRVDGTSWRPEFYACGPNPMLKAVGDRAIAKGWTAWLSLDKNMGCGVGACLACVHRIRGSDGTDSWLRVCREGPVFESRQIVWGKTDAG